MKTNPSISISFPRAERKEYLDKRDHMVAEFCSHVGVTSFSEIVRFVLDGKMEVVDGEVCWVVRM